jgi:hypothetical protein
VPWYADVLEDADTSGNESSKAQSALVKSRAGWRKEMARWV